MHRVNVAIFLTAVGLIGLAPLLLVGISLARRRADRAPVAPDTSAKPITSRSGGTASSSP